MNCNCLAAFAFVAAVAPAARSDLPSLPVSRAPFEQSADVARRPTTLATWPFHPPAGWNLLGEERLTTWAEFRSGDKFAVANGYDGRIHFVELHGLGSSINCLGRRVASYTTRDTKEIAKLLAMVS